MTASTTSMPPLGLASACSSSARLGDPPVRRTGGRAEAGQVDAVRRAEELLVRVGVLRRPLLEGREDRAAVVVGHHDRQVGPRLVGAEHQRGGVVQEGHVADVGDRAGAPRPAERGADRAGDGAVDAGQAAVGQHHPALADRVRAGHQVEVADRVAGADEEQAARRVGGVDDRRDVVRREAGLRRPRTRRCARRARGPPHATPRARPGRRPSAVHGGVLGVDRERPGGPATARSAPRPPRRRRARAAAAPAATGSGARRPRPARPASPRSVPSSSR